MAATMDRPTQPIQAGTTVVGAEEVDMDMVETEEVVEVGEEEEMVEEVDLSSTNRDAGCIP